VLLGLAKRTVFAVEDLKAFSESVFNDEIAEEDKKEYVKEQTFIMKNIIKETGDKMEEIKNIYKEMKNKFSGIKSNLVQYKLAVSSLLHNSSNAAGTTSMKGRAAVYSSAAGTTIACIIADILGALGICSAINAAVVASAATSLEVTLANMRNNLETLQQNGERAINDVEDLLNAQEDVEEYFFEEKKNLEFWEVALDALEAKLSRSDKIFFKDLPTIRERYIQSLDELGNAAQNYLSQDNLKTRKDSSEQNYTE
jgi:uncharacterized protein YukE